MSQFNGGKRLLALDVRPRSFGFVMFEGADSLLDWGVRSFRGGVNAVLVPKEDKLAALLEEFQPEVVVMRRPAPSSTRAGSVRDFKQTLRTLTRRGLIIALLPDGAVREAFPACKNKQEIAVTVAERFPDLAWKLPPKRKPWQREDYRMSIFDAAALGVAYLDRPSFAQTQ